MRSTIARKKVYAYLVEALPPLFERFRAEWEEGGTLPDGVFPGVMTAENVDTPKQGGRVYISPQEVKTIDDRLPLIAVTTALAQPYTAVEHVDALSEEFRGQHQMQVYCWVATEQWMGVVDAIEALAGCVVYAIALDHSLGSAEDGIKFVPNSLSVSYSEVVAHSGDGALAGAAVSFVVSTEDLVTLDAAGSVVTTEVAVHPAMED